MMLNQPNDLVLDSQWRHYAGDTVYVIRGFLIDASTDNLVVWYAAVSWDGPRPEFTRPIGEFLGTTKHQGKFVNRFQRVA